MLRHRDKISDGESIVLQGLGLGLRSRSRAVVPARLPPLENHKYEKLSPHCHFRPTLYEGEKSGAVLTLS